MATETTNYKLKKPSEDDFYNIADFNANADKIDAALAKKSETGVKGAGTNSEIFNDLPVDTERPHNTAAGDYAHAEGFQTVAGGSYSHAEGSNTNATGLGAHAGGTLSSASGNYSFAHGQQATANKLCAAAIGFHVKATLDYMLAVGKYNKPVANTLFVVGNGANSADANAFRVATDGNVYGAGAYNSTGADYAEMFEWLDGNSKGEDRRGLLVTLDGDKIRPATQEDDYVLGVVSANPGMVGNNYNDSWKGMYVTNLWGDVIVDDNGAPVISEDYDDSLEYVPREMRKEWGMVGLMGQLIVIDDGTCTVNGYCRPSTDGKATAAQSGYRVMKRMDDTHILVMVR